MDSVTPGTGLADSGSQLDVLSAYPEIAFDRVSRLAMRLFGVSLAVVSFIESRSQRFRSAYSLDVNRCDDGIAFDDLAIHCRHVVVIPDARADNRLKRHRMVRGSPGIRFYAGAPMITSEGDLLGTFCLLGLSPHDGFSGGECRILEDLASIVTDQMELRAMSVRQHAAREAISELEQRYRTVIEAASDGIVSIDHTGCILSANPAARQILCSSERDLIGLPLRRFIVVHDVRDLSSAPSGHVSGVVAGEVRTRAGSPVFVELTTGHATQSTGTVGTVIIRDVSAKRAAEESLKAAREAAEEASRAKSEFLSRMSHELRTPLNAILGFAQLLEQDELTPDQRDGNSRILKAGRHLLRLINEILDIARIEAGRLELNVETVDVHEAVVTAADMIRPLLKDRSLSLTLPSSPSRPKILADPQRLTQVFLNLLANAAKYNKSGGHIAITYETHVPDKLRVVVADSGDGIAPEEIPRLFIAFERLSASKTFVEGTGLGLVLCDRLLRAMGGTIGVDSTVGEGSRFSVDLPLACDIDKTEPPATDQGSAAATSRVAVATDWKATVLYVEDNVSNLALLESIFARHFPGVRLLSSMQGTLGIEMAVVHRPDLILLDLQLPDMDGVDVFRRLRSHPSTASIPVVIVSADATQRTMNRLAEMGAHEYLTKPIDVMGLTRTVQSLLLGPNVRE
jgi:PAS domain S-box-containing protein